MDIKVLGPGCKNCIMLTQRTKEAVEALAIEATIEKVEDYDAIASYGIMSTPGLVIDGHVVVAGKVPTVSAIEDLLSTHAK
ncbi:MAG: hypothetical protein RL720_639 [Actinomycetota bacterium]